MQQGVIQRTVCLDAKTSRDKDKLRKTKKDKSNKGSKGSELSNGEEELNRKEEARLRATQRSRDLREKLKRKNHRKEKEGSASDAEPSRHSASDDEAGLRKSLKKGQEKAKEKEEKVNERDQNKQQNREKERGKEQNKNSMKEKDQEGKSKEKTRMSEKDREQRKEKERKRELEKKTENQKTQIAEKQNTSESKVKSSTKELSKKRLQQTKLKKNDKTSDKSGRSSSESKTPTSPPMPAVKSSAMTKAASPPRTPPSPENDDVRGDVTAAHSPQATNIAATEEEMDTQQPHSPEKNENILEKQELTDSYIKKELESEKQAAGVPETPESPPARPQSKKKQKLESDLSSGEEFPESISGSPASPHSTAREEEEPQRNASTEKDEKSVKTTKEPVKFRINVSAKSSLPHAPPSKPSSGMVSPPISQWSPDPSSHRSSPSQPLRSHPPATHHSPPHLSGEESEEGSRKSKKLPRCYQLEEERLREKQREVKEHRHPKPHPLPTTPSPPPAYASHRRRPMHSPPPPEYERRWRQRGRHHSPGHQFGPRRYSRSPPPPGYPQSPPLPHGGGRSPYSGSPPPRPRTPIQRPRDRGGPRPRYESPPYDIARGKHGRRGSSPMRHVSPSTQLSRPRSPGPGHRYPRRYSRSPSLPRRSPLRRKDHSLSPGSSRSSPRYSEDKDRLEARKYGKKPPVPVYSRSPSPKPKRRDGPLRDDYPDTKRRRMDDMQMKSPTGGPSPSKNEQIKMSRSEKPQQSAYPPSGASDRHTPHHPAAGKESQQRHVQGSAQGGAHGNALSRSAHYPTPQSKTSQAIATATASTVSSSTPSTQLPPSQPPQQPTDNLMDLLRRYPVMWQGHLTLKNESAAVQLHFLSGNVQLAKGSLPGTGEGRSPALRIAQRMRLEQTQLEGLQRRMQNNSEHCLLLALPCGRDAGDVRTQTHALKNSLISYLLQKQAAGIINVPGSQTGFVLHIFPPCQFSQTHLSRVAPDLLSSASDNCHLMIVVATM